MNEKCKYCDYVSKCSRKCEYNSILCKTHRSFPKVVCKSYGQLQQENQQLKDNWNKLKQTAQSQSGLKKKCYNGGLWFEVDDLLDKMQELEGSDRK